MQIFVWGFIFLNISSVLGITVTEVLQSAKCFLSISLNFCHFISPSKRLPVFKAIIILAGFIHFVRYLFSHHHCSLISQLQCFDLSIHTDDSSKILGLIKQEEYGVSPLLYLRMSYLQQLEHTHVCVLDSHGTPAAHSALGPTTRMHHRLQEEKSHTLLAHLLSCLGAG